MKPYLYILLVILPFLGCREIQDERPASTFGAPVKISTDGPVYIPPACSPADNRSYGSLLNFQLDFPLAPMVNVTDKTLFYAVSNNNNDQLSIVLNPFIAKQSTIYTLSEESTDLGNYEAYVEFYANSMGSDKILAKSSTTQTRFVHVRYDANTDTYSMVFCDNVFKYEDFNGTSYITDINGRFSFSL